MQSREDVLGRFSCRGMEGSACKDVSVLQRCPQLFSSFNVKCEHASASKSSDFTGQLLTLLLLYYWLVTITKAVSIRFLLFKRLRPAPPLLSAARPSAPIQMRMLTQQHQLSTAHTLILRRWLTIVSMTAEKFLHRRLRIIPVKRATRSTMALVKRRQMFMAAAPQISPSRNQAG